MFPQRCNVRDIQGTFQEHFKGKAFLKVLGGKVVFVLKVYDLIIRNVDLFANSSNHEVMFPEYRGTFQECLFQKYSKDIPRIL